MKQAERLLFYFLFFAIPFQTRKILYSSGWYFNEWQSVSIYVTDLILLILFIFWAVDNRHRKSVIHRHDYFLLGFLIVALISVKNSFSFYSGFFLWLKLVEFAAFYFYLKSYAIERFNFIGTLYALIIGGVFQAVIAIAQFLKQGDLGLRWLGESVLGLDMTGVASFYVESGLKIIRAYGTTPHPNILAAYLLLAIFALYFLWFYKNQKTLGSRLWRGSPSAAWLLALGYSAILFGLFFTFSRTIIFVWAAGFLIMTVLVLAKNGLKKQFWQDAAVGKKLFQIIVVTILTAAVFSVLFWPEVSARLILSSEEEAVRLRVFYNEESLKGGINFFGIGLGDFTSWLMEQNPNLPRYVYQPVHNIYLLLYSETGLLGISMFLSFVFLLFKKSFSKRTLSSRLWPSIDSSRRGGRGSPSAAWFLALGFLFIGLFDHFFITLQQGRFVLWLGLTILAIGDIIPTRSERS